MMMKHKQQPVHAQHSRVNRNKFGNKIRLGKAVAATFAASRETDLDVAANVEITFTERFQSPEISVESQICIGIGCLLELVENGR